MSPPRLLNFNTYGRKRKSLTYWALPVLGAEPEEYGL